jgi:multicomponent Na+:H+ antiporter subunit C
VIDFIANRYVYVLVVVLLAVGLWTLLTERHLLKKVVGLTIFQTAIFLFFIEGSVREGADVPIIDSELGADPSAYVNPLPHLLILTALVVGVAVVGVALSLARVIHRAYGTLDEEEIARIEAER